MARDGGHKDLPKRNFYCPYTRNRKFELFLEDLFDLGFDAFRTRQEIAQYFQAVETYYTEKLRDFYLKRDGAGSCGAKRSQSHAANNQQITGIMIKNELMRVLIDSVEDVKKNIMRRRVKQEVKYNNRNKSLRGIEKSYLSEDNSYFSTE